jgi:hypothetical protein
MNVSVLNTIALILGSLATIIGALAVVYKIVRRMENAIGTDTKGRTLAERLDRVEHQLWENGGSSLADRVNKIEISSRETATEVKFIKELIINNAAIIAAHGKTAKKKG